MTHEKKMVNGFIIETTNPETGEVQWWDLKNGKKFTHKYVFAILQNLGWNYGTFLFLKEEGDLTNVYTDNLNCEVAVISTSLAKTIRKYKFVYFIKEK